MRGPWRSLVADRADALPAIAADADCMLVFTSGTTGTPKSFVLTHANLVANINGLLAERLVGPDDRALLPLPLHHVYPLTVGCLTALASGTTIVLPAGVTGPQIVGALQAGRVTLIVGVPRLYAALVAGLEARVKARGGLARALFALLFNLSLGLRRRFGLRVGRVLFRSLHRQLAPELWLMASGGARFEAELIWKLEALGWEVLSGYGLAETASILTANRRGRARIGSEGPPLPGAEMPTRRTQTNTAKARSRTRGPSVFAGYRNNPEANAAAFTADGWFRTGDLGTIDADGYVTITGRIKEMIVLGGGKNVYPEEVEKIYADNPAIRELAVLEQSGALVAAVLPNFDAIAATGNRRVEDVIRIALAERSRLLPSFQRIAGFAIVREPLPRTRLGKYQRFLLPEHLRAREGGCGTGRAAAELTAVRPRAARDARRHARSGPGSRRAIRTSTLAPDLSPQLDLGINSLEWVTMTLELAERFGIQLTEQDAADALTLRDLVVRASARGRQDERRRESACADRASSSTGWRRRTRASASPARSCTRSISALMRGASGLRVAGLDNVPLRGPLHHRVQSSERPRPARGRGRARPCAARRHLVGRRCRPPVRKFRRPGPRAHHAHLPGRRAQARQRHRLRRGGAAARPCAELVPGIMALARRRAAGVSQRHRPPAAAEPGAGHPGAHRRHVRGHAARPPRAAARRRVRITFGAPIDPEALADGRRTCTDRRRRCARRSLALPR